VTAPEWFPSIDAIVAGAGLRDYETRITEAAVKGVMIAHAVKERGRMRA
jgi:hypothetical protein